MGLFYAIRGFFGATGAPARQEGTQTTAPGRYSEPAACVNFDSAMQMSAVWAAVRITSETVGSMPFRLYQHDERGRVPADGHPLAQLLRNAPNRYQTPVEFWESVALNLCTSGNAYVIIQRLAGEIVSLLPVSSAQVETRLMDDGSVIHEVRDGADLKVYTNKTMWHIKLFGNGIVGLSPLLYAAQSIGIAIASDNRVSKIYSNGAKPTGVLTVDRNLTPEQRAKIRENYAEMTEGNNDRLFVLEASMGYHQVSMSPQDIQLLDSRRFQIEDIGRFFGVPSILLNQTFGQSSLGSNVYEIFQAYYKLNLRPFLEKIESSVHRWLLDPSERGLYEAEFDFDALLRADRETRIATNAQAIQTGQLTPAEARLDEGEVFIEGSDKLMVQGATVPIEQAGTVNATQNTGN